MAGGPPTWRDVKPKAKGKSVFSQRDEEGIDWVVRLNSPPRGQPPHLNGVDPYLVWTDLVSKASWPRDQGRSAPRFTFSKWVAILVELAKPGKPPLINPHDSSEVISLPSHFFRYWRRRFVPLLVDPVWIKWLVDNPSSVTNVVRFEYCQPHFVPDPGAFGIRPYSLETITKLLNTKDLGLVANNFFEILNVQSLSLSSTDTKKLATTPPVQQSQPVAPSPLVDRFANLPGPHRTYVPVPKEEQTDFRPLVLVIDDRCSFASPRLRDSSDKAIVRSLWHQSDDERVYERLKKFEKWTTSLAIVYLNTVPYVFGSVNGRRLEVARDLPFASIGEEAETYRETQYMPIREQWSHGSAVLDAIVNGQGPRNKSNEQLPARSVMFTQLPSPTVEDTGGGSLSCLVLDAIDDGLETTFRPLPAKSRPLLVNLSYGTYAGPHDGTSLFERALVERLADHENLHVVLPAGNSQLSRTHASGWLSPGRSTTLRWKVLPDSPGDSFVEVWFDAPAHAEVRLFPPGADPNDTDPSYKVAAGHAKVLTRSAAAKPMAAVIFPMAVAQGTNGSMALLAVCGTRQTQDRASDDVYANVGMFPRDSEPATAGVWQVKITNGHSSEAIHFDAWVQRGDSAPGRSRSSSGYAGRQGYFLDALDDTGATAGPDPSCTLNGIATGTYFPRLIVVGASRLYDGGLSTYSSGGPNRLETSRCEGADVVVPADESLALPGVLTGGMLGSARIRVGGTSIAAAVVTRMLYQHLAANKFNTAWSFQDQLRRVTVPTKRPMTPAGAPERALPVLCGAFQSVDPAAEGFAPGTQQGAKLVT